MLEWQVCAAQLQLFTLFQLGLFRGSSLRTVCGDWCRVGVRVDVCMWIWDTVQYNRTGRGRSREVWRRTTEDVEEKTRSINIVWWALLLGFPAARCHWLLFNPAWCSIVWWYPCLTQGGKVRGCRHQDAEVGYGSVQQAAEPLAGLKPDTNVALVALFHCSYSFISSVASSLVQFSLASVVSVFIFYTC